MVLGPLLCTLPFADRIVLVGDVGGTVKDILEGEAVQSPKVALCASPVRLLTIVRHSLCHVGMALILRPIARDSSQSGKPFLMG